MRTIHLFVEGPEDRELIETLLQRAWQSTHGACAVLTVSKEVKGSVHTLTHSTADLVVHMYVAGGYTKLSEIAPFIQTANVKRETVLVIFDADAVPDRRRTDLQREAERLGVTFELFLIPDDSAPGRLENLMENIVHPDHSAAFACFDAYERCLRNVPYPGLADTSYAGLDAKTRFYAYVRAHPLTPTQQEALRSYGGTKFFDHAAYWKLDVPALDSLKIFLNSHCS